MDSVQRHNIDADVAAANVIGGSRLNEIGFRLKIKTKTKIKMKKCRR
jgi:hypothetical protein